MKNKYLCIMDYQEFIEDLLLSTKRDGIEEVIDWLKSEDNFYEVPAAWRNHDNVAGGLAFHSFLVYMEAMEDWHMRSPEFKEKYPRDSVILATILHDVCKKDVYYIDDNGRPQRREENMKKGHGLRSVHLLEEHGLTLTDDEKNAIWWHMGPWSIEKTDFPDEFYEAQKDPFCKLVHQADYRAANKSTAQKSKKRF